MEKILLTILIAFGLFGFIQINNLQQEKWVAPASAKKTPIRFQLKKEVLQPKKEQNYSLNTVLYVMGKWAKEMA